MLRRRQRESRLSTPLLECASALPLRTLQRAARPSYHNCRIVRRPQLRSHIVLLGRRSSYQKDSALAWSEGALGTSALACASMISAALCASGCILHTAVLCRLSQAACGQKGPSVVSFTWQTHVTALALPHSLAHCVSLDAFHCTKKLPPLLRMLCQTAWSFVMSANYTTLAAVGCPAVAFGARGQHHPPGGAISQPGRDKGFQSIAHAAEKVFADVRQSALVASARLTLAACCQK